MQTQENRIKDLTVEIHKIKDALAAEGFEVKEEYSFEELGEFLDNLIVSLNKETSKVSSLDELQDNWKEIYNNLFKGYVLSMVGDIIGSYKRDKNPEKTIKFSVSYNGKVFSESVQDLSQYVDEEEFFKSTSSLIQVLYKVWFLDSFINPKLRNLIMQNKDGYAAFAQSYFQGISDNTGKVMLELIKNNYPDFYTHLTDKLEIPKLEELDEWMAQKKELAADTETK